MIETEVVNHEEVVSMNGGGRSISHNEKRGAGAESMCLNRRRRGLQSDEMYLADDIDTKLPQSRNPRKCLSQLPRRRLELKSIHELRLRLNQLPYQRHR